MDIGPVDVTIDLLCIEGVGSPDPARLGAAVERHLAALLTRDARTVTRARVDGPVELDWDGRGGDDGLARALAHGIHRALRP